MAAPMESIAFCKIINESSLISVSEGHNDDTISVTTKGKCLDIYKLSDQKLIKSWSLRHGLTITSPLVWDKPQEKFMCVINYKDVHSWSDGINDFDKSKKKHSKANIHQLMLAPDHEPVLLYKTGIVDFVSNIKTADQGKGLLLETDTILWCKTVFLQSNLHVLFLAKTKKGVKVYVHSYDDSSGRWSESDSQIEFPTGGCSLDAYDCVSFQNEANITLLWSGGRLSCVNVIDGVITQSTISHTVAGVHGDCSIATLDDLHIAIAGVTRGDQEGLCIFDTKFGLQKSWQTFAEKPRSKPKIYRVANHLFVPSQSTLYAYKYECQTSTVVSLLGQNVDAQPAVPMHYLWDPHKKKQNVKQNNNKTLKLMFEQITNHSLNQSSFKKLFSDLLPELAKIENHHWLTSEPMTTLIHYMLSKYKFWPKQQLEELISLHYIPTSMLGELCTCLIEKSEKYMIHSTLCNLPNIPEKCLCTAITFYLQNDTGVSGKRAGRAGEKMDTDHSLVNGGTKETDHNLQNCQDDQNSETTVENVCPVSEETAKLVNHVLSMPYSDVFLLECLRKIAFKHALKLLEYLSYLLGSKSGFNNSTDLSLVQVVDWLCLVLDAHITQFVLSPDCHICIVKLKSKVAQQVTFYDELLTLDALLEQFKQHSSLPTEQKIGHYCIEVLHIA